MYYYAVVDVNYIVTQIGMDEVEVNDPAWIPIDSENYDLVGLWYDIETQTYSHVGNKYLNPLKVVDGTGSGLDADLLDGKHASEFALANHTHENMGGGSVGEHDHDDEYAAIDHTHTEYASAEHTHTGYASEDHSHNEYAEAGHTHSGYAPANHDHDEYAASNHTHSEYAGATHTHDEYAPASHSHDVVNKNVIINKTNANVILKISDLEKGVLPTTASYDGTVIQDKNGEVLGNIRYAQETDGDAFLQFRAYDYRGDAASAVDMRLYKTAAGEAYAQLPSLVRLASGNQAIYETSNYMIFGTGNKPTLIACKSDSPVTVNGNRMDVPSIVPRNTNTHGLGISGQRFKDCYLVNSPNVSSDRRLKDNIESVDADRMLKFIDKLNVVDYVFKDSPEIERIGLIAQEVEEVGGDKFVEIGDDGMYGLKGADLVYPLIAAVQALYSRVLELEAKVE